MPVYRPRASSSETGPPYSPSWPMRFTPLYHTLSRQYAPLDCPPGHRVHRQSLPCPTWIFITDHVPSAFFFPIFTPAAVIIDPCWRCDKSARQRIAWPQRKRLDGLARALHFRDTHLPGTASDEGQRRVFKNEIALGPNRETAHGFSRAMPSMLDLLQSTSGHIRRQVPVVRVSPQASSSGTLSPSHFPTGLLHSGVTGNPSTSLLCKCNRHRSSRRARGGNLKSSTLTVTHRCVGCVPAGSTDFTPPCVSGDLSHLRGGSGESPHSSRRFR
ncbi:hypothetical protein BC628DRAFT_847349 [Trametes gibbosa]|nr:hypothetical protein BC628DRAFT_847349 [Trametes gibbosa]